MRQLLWDTIIKAGLIRELQDYTGYWIVATGFGLGILLVAALIDRIG
jgi:hypothetical protein